MSYTLGTRLTIILLQIEGLNMLKTKNRAIFGMILSRFLNFVWVGLKSPLPPSAVTVVVAYSGGGGGVAMSFT